MNNVAMIPVRLGSKRIKYKNLRLINGKPLVSYVIESAINSNVFDQIYINSEAEEFREIADKYGISFYKRPENLASDSASNDDFVLDFIDNIDCNILTQILATSPFITSEDIRIFANKSLGGDTIISVKDEQIECLYKNKAINFDQKSKTLPSQMLEPIKVYACGLMAWKTKKFKENISRTSRWQHWPH